jgi:N-methylhydantoinase B
VSCIVDRTAYPAPGLRGGHAGAAGEFVLDDGQRPNPKSQVDLLPRQTVHLNTPGGGGYGDPLQRDPERVRRDVVAGYVSATAAERDFGVVVRYTGREDALVRPDARYVVDHDATNALRTRSRGVG